MFEGIPILTDFKPRGRLARAMSNTDVKGHAGMSDGNKQVPRCARHHSIMLGIKGDRLSCLLEGAPGDPELAALGRVLGGTANNAEVGLHGTDRRSFASAFLDAHKVGLDRVEERSKVVDARFGMHVLGTISASNERLGIELHKRKEPRIPRGAPSLTLGGDGSSGAQNGGRLGGSEGDTTSAEPTSGMPRRRTDPSTSMVAHRT